MKPNALSDELSWIGFIVTALVGGIVGYIKAFEQSNVVIVGEKFWNKAQRIGYGILRRGIMAGFAGYLVYQISVEYNWSVPTGHVISGIAGVFASEFLEVVWFIVKKRVRIFTLENENTRGPN